jgi:tRNA pseudouridine55 synthase
MATADVSGVLLIDKPVGPTSFDVVRSVKHALRVKSAGHTGTLDPNASGLLPVCVGDATRIAAFITAGVKEYEGVVHFGVTTTTLDAEGEITAQREVALTLEQVEAEVARLVGRQDQVVPMYSAHKVGGRRLYELAREGLEVERPSHEITVEEARLVEWAPPKARIQVRCSKGTYIRSLAALLGERLGVGAHLSALRRLSSGPFRVDAALDLAGFTALAKANPEAARGRLLTVELALAELPECRLDARRAASVAFGNPVATADRAASGCPHLPAGAFARITDPDGAVVAVGESDAAGGLRLARVLRSKTGPGVGRARPQG